VSNEGPSKPDLWNLSLFKVVCLPILSEAKEDGKARPASLRKKKSIKSKPDLSTLNEVGQTRWSDGVNLPMKRKE